MIYCTKCGKENVEGTKSCVNCGKSLISENHRKKEDTCFGEGVQRRNYLGLVSFGIFIIIVGIIFGNNPNVISDFRLWIEQMVSEQLFTRPPVDLLNTATLFFGLLGLSNFFMAVIRFMFEKVRRRVLTDILSGVALVLFAYLLHLYEGYVITWQKVLAIEAIACGLLIILYSLVRYEF